MRAKKRGGAYTRPVLTLKISRACCAPAADVDVTEALATDTWRGRGVLAMFLLHGGECFKAGIRMLRGAGLRPEPADAAY